MQLHHHVWESHPPAEEWGAWEGYKETQTWFLCLEGVYNHPQKIKDSISTWYLQEHNECWFNKQPPNRVINANPREFQRRDSLRVKKASQRIEVSAWVLTEA